MDLNRNFDSHWDQVSLLHGVTASKDFVDHHYLKFVSKLVYFSSIWLTLFSPRAVSKLKDAHVLYNQELDFFETVCCNYMRYELHVHRFIVISSHSRTRTVDLTTRAVSCTTVQWLGLNSRYRYSRPTSSHWGEWLELLTSTRTIRRSCTLLVSL